MAIAGIYCFFIFFKAPSSKLESTTYLVEMSGNYLSGSLLYYALLLLISGYLQQSIYYALGLFVLILFFFILKYPAKILKLALLFTGGFLLLMWKMSIYSEGTEQFDFYSHWGYVVKRILIDQKLPHTSRIYEYSMWNYPEMAAAWALPSQIFFKSEMLIRYRSVPLLVCIAALGIGLLSSQSTKKLGLSVLTTTLLILLWKPFFPGIYFSGYGDLPFTLVSFLAGIFLLKYLESKNFNDLLMFCISIAVATQVRYDGIFFYPILLFASAYLLKNKKNLSRYQLFFLGISITTPWLWIVYQKWVGDIHGSFEKLSPIEAVKNIIPVLIQFLKEYRVFLYLTPLNLFLTYRLRDKFLWGRNIAIYSLIACYLAGIFYVSAAEWGSIYDTQRFCCRISPLLYVISFYNFFSFLERTDFALKFSEKFSSLFNLFLLHQRWILSGLFLFALLFSLMKSQLALQMHSSSLPEKVASCVETFLSQAPPNTPINLILDDGTQHGMDVGNYFELRHKLYPIRVEAIYRKNKTPEYDWNIDQGENQIRIASKKISCTL